MKKILITLFIAGAFHGGTALASAREEARLIEASGVLEELFAQRDTAIPDRLMARAYGIASFTRGRLSPHVNAGYTFSTEGALHGTTLLDEVNVAAGVDVVLSPRATLVMDYLGRSLIDAGRLREADRTSTAVRYHCPTAPSSSASTTGGGYP